MQWWWWKWNERSHSDIEDIKTIKIGVNQSNERELT